MLARTHRLSSPLQKSLVNELESIKYKSSGLFWNESYAKTRLITVLSERQSYAKLRGLISLCRWMIRPHAMPPLHSNC